MRGEMRSVRQVMGMPVTVEVRDAGADAGVLDRIFHELEMVDRLFSPFLPHSEVSRIDRGELALEEADSLVIQVLHLCRLYELATDGYFSACRQGRLDPSGLVKGWALERACSILDSEGFQHYLVDGAGDVRTRRPPGAGRPWRVGIRHPVQRDRVVRVIEADDLAVATSGTYEKGAHVVDPHSGRPATEWVSFTVVGPDILEADVYATAALAMGQRGLWFVEALPRYEAYAIDTELKGSWTSGFPARKRPPECPDAGRP